MSLRCKDLHRMSVVLMPDVVKRGKHLCLGPHTCVGIIRRRDAPSPETGVCTTAEVAPGP
jgi:hypothetical protein